MKLDKSRIYPIVVIFAMFVVYQCRKSDYEDLKKDLVILEGPAMGTRYDIRYYDTLNRNLQPGIDSVIASYNQLFSTYIDNSDLSILNTKETSGIKLLFFEILSCAARVHSESEGYYDPTILPLIKRWGFGSEDQETAPTQREIDSLLKVVGFDKITFNETTLSKPLHLQLDLSSIAKGMTVDAVSDYLFLKNISNHKIDIGGELVCKGRKTNGEGWIVGVKRPERHSDKKRQLLEMKDMSLATSGNYANIRTYSDKQYGHTLNPKTGKPEKNQLLSVSILSDNCMKADAFATACMAAGLKKSIQIIERNEDIEGYLIYSEGDDIEEYYSSNVKKIIKNE